jgi:hypothetical protein
LVPERREGVVGIVTGGFFNGPRRGPVLFAQVAVLARVAVRVRRAATLARLLRKQSPEAATQGTSTGRHTA